MYFFKKELILFIYFRERERERELGGVGRGRGRGRSRLYAGHGARSILVDCGMFELLKPQPQASVSRFPGKHQTLKPPEFF